MGIEAIIAGDGKRVGLGIVAGLIVGCGFALGMQPMLQDGIGKVAGGLTSLEEVMRVTREIE